MKIIQRIYNLFKINKSPKRVFDIIFSVFVIIIFSPLLVIISILIKIISPKGEIIFKQKRLGLNGKIFNVYKFRTMVPNAEKILKELMQKDPKIKKEYLKYKKIKNDPRIIPYIGNFLRKTSLDELPQFFNVLKGEMSIIGPRPYMENELKDLDPKEREYLLSIKPGITGYWKIQPNRNRTTFKFRVLKDIEYIKNRNILLDIKIFFLTIYVMLSKKGL